MKKWEAFSTKSKKKLSFMKQIKVSVLSLLLCFTMLPTSWYVIHAVTDTSEMIALTDQIQPESGKTYTISDKNQFNNLAKIVNNGNICTGVTFILTENIVINEGDLSGYDGTSPNNWEQWKPINKFDGTLDGAGHTISGIYINDNSKNVAATGLFYNIGKNATVKNIGVINSYMYLESEDTFIQVGGICVENQGIIENCYYDGIVKNTGKGGRTGAISVNNRDGATIKNCYTTEAVLCSSNNYSDTTLENCYYLGTQEIDSIDGTTYKTAEQFSSGEVAYLLNKGITDGTQAFYQNIQGTNRDSYPVLDDSHGTVYQKDNTYSNMSTTIIDGKTYYEIGTATQLKTFRDMANGQRNINGILTSDIVLNMGDLSGYDGTSSNTWEQWKPITVQYQGVFDGNGHTISGVYIKSDASYQGLFADLGVNGEIRNLGVVNSYIKGKYYVGGISGLNRGKIINCFSSATVTGNSYLGGISGDNEGSSSVENSYNSGNVSGNDDIGGVSGINLGTIKNCYNTGSINSTGRSSGGVCGWNRYSIVNCYNIGTVSGNAFVGSISGSNSDTASITNSYYLKTDKINANLNGVGSGSDTTIAKTDAHFSSGEVTYLLNEGVTDGTQAFYQNIEGTNLDRYPVIDNSHGTVYQPQKGDFTNTSDATYSVELEWGTMEFTYQEGEWNADTLTYAPGEWQCATDSNRIKVKNKSNVSVEANMKHQIDSEYSTITASIKNDNTVINKSVIFPKSTEKDFYVELNGTLPNKQMNLTKIGTITVTISGIGDE